VEALAVVAVAPILAAPPTQRLALDKVLGDRVMALGPVKALAKV
jgi:hypothetical protein